ncbi:hypothetical protein AGDE_13285 [Angomonas deanei]|nr:hypothetical protein AGDE_13285 [Angomonas deanei]|eukprot:EPY22482.1 hypothetical protein AGDE_13285 [Angomonas deanei]
MQSSPDIHETVYGTPAGDGVRDPYDDEALHMAQRDSNLRERRMENEAYRQAWSELAGAVFQAAYTAALREQRQQLKQKWQS